MVEMRMAGDAGELSLADQRHVSPKAEWPSLSKSRSRSRPRTCQMLQWKKGFIHGSWISVTPSPRRMVSYQRAASIASVIALARRQRDRMIMSPGTACSSTVSPTATG